MKTLLLTLSITTAALPLQFSVAQSDTLNNTEKNHLLLMREEEKLARDVYLALGERYSKRVFVNIPNAENRHMNALLPLLTRYGLTDPVTDDTLGKFDNPEMAALYAKLVSEGQGSELAALKVGAFIEELDIADLTTAISDTDNPDVTRVYENLLRGSRNHLRAFMRQIERLGGEYQPQHISPARFDKIVDSSMERGRNN